MIYKDSIYKDNIRQCCLEAQLSYGTVSTKLSPSHMAAHRRQTPVTHVSHDLLVGDAVAIGRGHETRPQPVRLDRLGERTPDPGQGRALEQDLTHGVLAETARLDPAKA
jgi:hypothetical protein